MAFQYKVAGQTVELKLDPTVVAVRFKADPPHSVRATAAERAGAGPFAARFEIPGEKLTLVPTPVGAARIASASAESSIMGALSSLNDEPEVAIALPVFRDGANRIVTTDRVIVGLRDPAKAGEVAGKYDLRQIEARDGKMVCQAPDGSDPFALVARLDGDPAVRFAEPDFVTIGPHLPKRAQSELVGGPDPQLAEQYAMTITRAVDAWNVTPGDPAIKIAILDEGVDTSHPDLAAAVVASYDAVDDDSYQEPNRWDGHGTACAGLAAAVGDNAIGVRGVAAGCALLAVRIAHSQRPGGPWITTNSKIARAIKWCRDNGADVLSNSWGGGAPSNDIIDEFERARTQGRSGRGAVVVVAAGNDFGPVSFPANLPDVLTVAASNEYDEAKTPTSLDGENWWGSSHGPEVDVAAPGVHNLTTDIAGAAGYVNGDYEPSFNGTSSSTPIVAGACALALSANPSLSEQELREIIKASADKVGQFAYDNGRNDHLGHGRLNVLEAVLAARAAARPAATRARATRLRNAERA